MSEYPDMASWEDAGPMGQAATELPLVTVLSRVAAEADFLATALLRFEHDIGRALGEIDGEGLPTLQDVDATRQGIEGLGHFLSALCRQLDPDVMCAAGAAAHCLTMRAQVRRLVGDLPATDPADDPPEIWS
ncbi:MAG: hypothetical protein ACK41U_10280 [Paracoccus sp. (in: a-proteobacteria)]|uniref:hypothetical protein n=1 Tax=Paracoccus sp. TaxID=267 RepID=UPI0039196123